MKLIIRTEAKNVEYLFKKFRLNLEGTTTKMCRVEGTPDNIKGVKSELEKINYEYFDYTETSDQSEPALPKPTTSQKLKRKRRDA